MGESEGVRYCLLEKEMTDEQIDRLVYELYGLTDDEIKIVEEATQ
jgi:hypothetical protein